MQLLRLVAAVVLVGLFSLSAALAVPVRTLYGTASASPGPTSPSRLITINQTTGAGTLGPAIVGAFGAYGGVEAIDFQPGTNVLYGIGRRVVGGQSALITINRLTGFAVEVGLTGLSTTQQTTDISFDPTTGVLWAYIEPNDDRPATVNIITGAVTIIPPGVASPSAGSGLALDAAGNLYHADSYTLTTQPQLQRLNKATGDVIAGSQVSIGNYIPGQQDRFNSLEFHPDNDNLFGTRNSSLGGFTPLTLEIINKVTGGILVLGPIAPFVGAIAFGPLVDDELPVELTSFGASSANGAVSITWSTASESQNAGFELMRKGPGMATSELIASYRSTPELIGLGTSQVGRNYNYVDGVDGGLVRGATYQYTLVDVALDGSRLYHGNVDIRVEAAEPQDVAMFDVSNVAIDASSSFAQFQFTLAQPSVVSVEIFGADGRLAANSLTSRDYANGTHAEVLNLESLVEGTYFLRFRAGRETRVRRFEVVR